MISHQKTMNYARALFHVEGTSEQVHERQEHLEKLSEAMAQAPKMIHLLGCPDLPMGDKIGLLEKILGKPMETYLKRLITLLLERGRAVLIRPIAKEYHKLVIYSLKEIEVELASAEPLSEEVKAQIRRKLEDKFQIKVNFIETIDPKLLGGFTILVHDKMLDLSIRGKLLNFKKQLLKT